MEKNINDLTVRLANSLDINIPYNKGIYDLSKKQFETKPYQPLTVESVWDKIHKNLNK